MNEETAPPPRENHGPADAELGGAAEISRRVGSILDAVEREAQRLREEAREEARRYLQQAERHADALVAERQLRIAELSDELISRSEAVVARLDDAVPIRQGFENLVRALGDAAELLSRETEASGGNYQPQAFDETAGQSLSYAATPYAPAEQAPPAPPAPPPHDAYSPPPEPATPRPAPAEAFPAQPHPARAPSTPGWEPLEPATPSANAPPASAGWRQLDDVRMIAIQLAAGGSTRAAVREHLIRALGAADTDGILDEIFGAGTGEDAQVPWTAGPR